MSFIISFLLILMIALLLAIDIASWVLIGWQIGVAGLVSIIAFLIFYGISVQATISPRDYFSNSEWGVFRKKLTWAWGATAIVFAISYIVIAYYFGDVIDVMPANIGHK